MIIITQRISNYLKKKEKTHTQTNKQKPLKNPISPFSAQSAGDAFSHLKPAT